MQEAEAVTVEVGIYSGRRNPEMTLSGDLSERVIGMLRETIGVQATHAQPRAKLGHYYGFLVRTPPSEARRLDLPAEVAIYEGVVAEPGRAMERGWRDTVGLERFLLRQAVLSDYRNLLEEAGVDTSEITDTGN